ncbi:MAG: glutamine--tRNA ligase, partial [Clostridia bacterium]|nr:glutamine--tRNA ligase [Clostridia bacterium]
YIQSEDFMIDPPKKFFRLFVGGEVRLKSAYIVKCTSYKTDENGNVTEVHCEYDPETKSGCAGADRKVKGTLHWIDAQTAVPAEFRLYDYLLDEREGEGLDFSERVNPDSLIVKQGFVEASLKDAEVGDSYQFIRVGYFRKDEDSTEAMPVFNRIVGLRDSWAKQNK